MRYALVLLSVLLPFAASAQTTTAAPGRGTRDGAPRLDAATTIAFVPTVYVRLSEAYAEAGHADAALASIEMAAALAPRSADILRRRATLATWTGAYGRAQESYRRLLDLEPRDMDATLGLARTSAWAGDTDAAVAMYRKYLAVRGIDAEAWIELARAEAWRGNYAASWNALDEYRTRFGETLAYARERAAVLARGGRPRAAMPLIDRLLDGAPADFGLNVSRTIALAARQRRSDALAASATVERLGPGQPETRGAHALVRASVASTGEPRASFYSDSDGLQVRRIDPRVSVAVSNGTRLEAGYERADLRARPGSGLDQVGGATEAQHELTWIGFSQRAGLFSVRANGGYATIGSGDRFAYMVAAAFVSDHVRLSASRESAFFVVSPRTVGLGLTRLTHRTQLEWSPSFRSVVAIEGTYDELSDGNRRWDVLVAPRRSMLRTQRLNLDLGAHLRQFGTTEELDNGYYDPSRYESYAVVVYPYWKVSESTGIGGLASVGVQRADRLGSFELGANAAVEATFGIYRGWMLKLNGSATLNERLQSGAFRGFGGQAVLVRRF